MLERNYMQYYTRVVTSCRVVAPTHICFYSKCTIDRIPKCQWQIHNAGALRTFDALS